MNPRDVVERSARYPVPVEQVWSALTQAGALSEWFGLHVEVLDLREGGRLLFRDAAGRTRRALIETVDAPKRFAFRWLPGRPGDVPEPGSRVEFTLAPTEDGTELTVVETPWLAVGELLPMVSPNIMGASPLTPPGAPPEVWSRSGPEFLARVA